MTHDQEEALEVADRVVLMDHGKVEQVGTPDEVYNHPQTPFVYGFLGSVNLFHGRVDDGHLHVGDDVLHDQGENYGPGSEVYAFARPHELDIVVDTQQVSGLSAKVNRVLSFGLNSRVELDGINSAHGQHFEVELSPQRVHELSLIQGQIVKLVPSKLKLFQRDSVQKDYHA